MADFACNSVPMAAVPQATRALRNSRFAGILVGETGSKTRTSAALLDDSPAQSPERPPTGRARDAARPPNSAAPNWWRSPHPAIFTGSQSGDVARGPSDRSRNPDRQAPGVG